MALGGVETGSTTATEADRPAATAGTTGSTPAAIAMETMIGMAILVAAVFDIALDSTTVNSAPAKVSGTTASVGNRPVMPSPTASARPVDDDSAPSESPPPNKRMVPQSICAACFQVMVVRCSRLAGSRNSRMAPESAATDSGTLACSNCASGWSRPMTRASRPGPTHKQTVTPKASTAFRWPAVHGPSACLRSATMAVAPGISRTPVRPIRLR